MGLNKVTYVDNETVIYAQNLNDIQDAIIELEEGGGGGGTSIDLGITGATAGTYAKVKTIDANGKPTSWETGAGGSGGTNYVTLSGTTVTQTGVDNTMYLCGELTELTFTAPQTGITAIRFTSGTTPTVVTLTGITMPDDWEGAEASTEYEINVLNGYGVYQKWAVSGS